MFSQNKIVMVLTMGFALTGVLSSTGIKAEITGDEDKKINYRNMPSIYEYDFRCEEKDISINFMRSENGVYVNRISVNSVSISKWKYEELKNLLPEFSDLNLIGVGCNKAGVDFSALVTSRQQFTTSSQDSNFTMIRFFLLFDEFK